MVAPRSRLVQTQSSTAQSSLTLVIWDYEACRREMLNDKLLFKVGLLKDEAHFPYSEFFRLDFDLDLGRHTLQPRGP